MKLIAILIAIFVLLGLPASAAAASGGVGFEQPSKVKPAKIKNGLAYPAKGTPKQIVRAIRAANRIAKKPYAWGGGHALWNTSLSGYLQKYRGFDCSGSVSFVLGRFGGGFLKSPKNSSAFLSWGKRGRGRWFTVYTSHSHAYLVIAGIRFDTSGLDERGTRWSRESKGMRGLEARRI